MDTPMQKKISALEAKIEKYRQAEGFLDGLEALRDEISMVRPTDTWHISCVPEVDDAPDFRITLPGALFAELVGTGLRVLVPIWKERLENFDLNSD